MLLDRSGQGKGKWFITIHWFLQLKQYNRNRRFCLFDFCINRNVFDVVYQLISRRRFQQMEVLEGQNILVTISGKKNKIRVYYLSWLKAKIFKADTVSVSGSILNNICVP